MAEWGLTLSCPSSADAHRFKGSGQRTLQFWFFKKRKDLDSVQKQIPWSIRWGIQVHHLNIMLQSLLDATVTRSNVVTFPALTGSHHVWCICKGTVYLEISPSILLILWWLKKKTSHAYLYAQKVNFLSTKCHVCVRAGVGQTVTFPEGGGAPKPVFWAVLSVNYEALPLIQYLQKNGWVHSSC